MVVAATCRSPRALFALSLALASACADADDLPNADPPELHEIASAATAIQSASQAVVRVQHPAGGAGTGSFISPDGLLLTNNHVLGTESCAREGCSVTLSFEHQLGTLSLPPRRLFAVPRHVSAGLDMAVVRVYLDETLQKPLSTPHFLTLESRTADQLVGTRVTAIGHPLGRLKKWSSGTVIHADGEWFQSTIFSLPGGSGSPILNDAGHLVGLLHRGAEGFDLLTATSSQVSAIGTSSAALEPALAAPLPATVISVLDPLSEDEARAHSDVFLAASAWNANVNGQSVPLARILRGTCDQNLARDDFNSLEELQSALSPCFTALSFIECRTDSGEENEKVPRECPSAEVSVWRERMQHVFDKQRDFNGSLDLSAITFSVEVLANTYDQAQQISRDNLLAALDAAKPTLDFSTASYLAAYGIESYNGQSTRDLFVNYARVPFYERYGWDIAISSLWLYAADLMNRDQAIDIAKQLYGDDKISLGSKLRIEEVLYNADEL